MAGATGCVVLALLASVAAASESSAQSRQPYGQSRPLPKLGDTYGHARPGSPPLLAVVALGEQRITVYDAAGKILHAPISSGSTGYETPAGIFSVVQKKEEHESNLYEDGKMPFMQRITWTGIALHAGALPGQPASHGCVRMPLPFAERLFGLTDLGMRVVLVRHDIAPVEIAHPKLFGSARKEAALPSHNDAVQPGSPKHLVMLKAAAAAKIAEADAAARRAGELRRVAARKAMEASPFTRAAKAAEANSAKAAEFLKVADRALESLTKPPESGAPAEGYNEISKNADLARARAEKARLRVAEAERQLQTARDLAQTKADAAARALEEANAADGAREAAAEAAEEAKRKTQPVSVFVSRKTQRFYVRQAFQPVYEGPVSILEVDRPLGTYVFTAVGHASNSAEVRWNVVSMYSAGEVQPARYRYDAQKPAAPADTAGAKQALDRIIIPRDAVEKASEIVLPGSSLIISDEGPSIETGKDTDFVVIMPNEPQGALKIRKREPISKFKDDDGWPFGSSSRSPYKSKGGGFFSLFN